MSQVTSGQTAVRDLLSRCQQFASLRPRLSSVVADPEPDLARVPPMDKTTLAEALAEMAEPRWQRSAEGCYLFGSGGTTDAPKLSLIPGHLFVPDVVAHWRPLDRRDVLVNMFNPGRLWSAHYFYNHVGTALAGQTIALGSASLDDLPAWAELLNRCGMTAVAATPTTLKRCLQDPVVSAAALGRVRKLLWVGEPFDGELERRVGDALPGAEPWGLYGSTETWVIGHNGPRCDRDVFHPLPYQLVEIVDGEIVVSNLHPDCRNPILRYRLGDLGEFAACRCGSEAGGVRVRGRADSAIRFRSHGLTPEDLIRIAGSFPDVAAAQVVVRKRQTGPDLLQLDVVPRRASRPDVSAIRRRILDRSLDLKNMFESDPDGFQVTLVESLATNARTSKTPPLVTMQVE